MFYVHQTHGFRGEKYIEKVGLGIDGHEEERREQQRIRDQGRLQGVIYEKENLNPILKLEDWLSFWLKIL